MGTVIGLGASRGERIMKRLFIAAAAVSLGVALSAQAAPVTYTTPYANGPQTGTSSNTIQRDPAQGTITIIGRNLTPGAINCGAVSGYSTFRVSHTAAGSETGVTVNYEATLDNFSWVVVSIRGAANRWLGYTAVRGPKVRAAAALAVPFEDVDPVSGAKSPIPVAEGETLTIDFGLQVGSACPNVNVGTVKFPSIVVA